MATLLKASQGYRISTKYNDSQSIFLFVSSLKRIEKTQNDTIVLQ
jgi:hypothetical protein